MRRLQSLYLRHLTGRPGALRLGVGVLLLATVAGCASLALSRQGSSPPARTATGAPTPEDASVLALVDLAPEFSVAEAWQLTSVADYARYVASLPPPPPPPPPPPRHYYGSAGAGSYFETGMSLEIPRLGVQLGVSGRRVGTSGVMADPAGPWDVVWYDFSDFGIVGGYPTEPESNAVFAGHVNYVGVGLAAFGGIDQLQPGDTVTVHTPEGSVTYVVEISYWVSPYQDFSQHIMRAAPGWITLITCVGTFSGGDYSHRLVVRGKRI